MCVFVCTSETHIKNNIRLDIDIAIAIAIAVAAFLSSTTRRRPRRRRACCSCTYRCGKYNFIKYFLMHGNGKS